MAATCTKLHQNHPNSPKITEITQEASGFGPRRAELPSAVPPAPPPRTRASRTGRDGAGASGTEPARAGASRTEPERAGRSRGEPDGAGRSRSEPERAGASRTESDGAGRSRPEPERAGASRSEPHLVVVWIVFACAGAPWGPDDLVELFVENIFKIFARLQQRKTFLVR